MTMHSFYLMVVNSERLASERGWVARCGRYESVVWVYW
jgi:hypothetical protein